MEIVVTTVACKQPQFPSVLGVEKLKTCYFSLVEAGVVDGSPQVLELRNLLNGLFLQRRTKGDTVLIMLFLCWCWF